jgi:hypothetical protein
MYNAAMWKSRWSRGILLSLRDPEALSRWRRDHFGIALSP